jgi:hypothetical protein
MSLCPETELATLQSWGFIPLDQKYENELLGVASTVYRVVSSEKKTPPEPADCVTPLKFALLTSPGFGSMLRGMVNLKPQNYQLFAGMMARYLLENYWLEIQRI